MRRSTRLAAAVALVGVGVTVPARANPRPFPFTYIYETLAEGEFELEQYGDVTPLKAVSTSTGNPQWYLPVQLQTELEYGITDRLELGLYFTLAPSPGESLAQTATLPVGNGLKQRLRYRFADEGEWPLDVALYGEVSESDREIELEAKVILQKRIGPVRIATNLWAERELYYENRRDWVLNPTLGVTVQATPSVHPGIEYWMRAEYPDPSVSPRPFTLGPHHYVGATLMLNFGKLWWTNGAYLRASDFGHTMQPGDAFGSVWFRTVAGVGF